MTSDPWPAENSAEQHPGDAGARAARDRPDRSAAPRPAAIVAHAVIAAAALVVGGIATFFVMMMAIFGGYAAIIVALVAACLVVGLIVASLISTYRGSHRVLLGIVTPLLGVGVAIAVIVARGGAALPADPIVPAGLALAGVGASTALLSHRGVPRIVGAALLAVVVVSVSVLVVAGLRAETRDDALERFGSPLHPQTTAVEGYSARGEAFLVPLGDDPALIAIAIVADGAPEPSASDSFLVTTGGEFCEGPMVLPPAALPVEASGECVERGDGRMRQAEGFTEVSVMRDGVVVRATGSDELPEGVLDSALAAAHPISDCAWMHLLLGEQGCYIAELDGRR